LLERFDLEVVYPPNQTCCGQPMANSGFEADAAGAEALFVHNFDGFDYIVGPSGSCVHHIRHHFTAVEQTEKVSDIRSRTYELVEFLHEILKVDAFPWARFPHKVGLHNSCGPLRGLRHARASELREPHFSKPEALLSKVDGLELVAASRPADRSGRRRPAKDRAVGNYPDKAFDSKGPSPPFEYGACSGSPKAYVRCSNHALARITGCFLARSDTNT
jgi:L-lactate dehydrogenase complex protein LldE